jgi:signal transduction histidine kinase
MAGGFRRTCQATASRLRGQLGVAAPRSHGRLAAEIVLALAVGLAAFVLVAVVGTAARSHVPDVLFGILLLLVVLAVARFSGILYALPVGVATILAFDWYFLPPVRKLDAPTLLVLALFLVMAVIVGAFATNAGRRATGSEEARGALAEEQAALRRVATIVAGHRSPAEVFAAVTEEAGKLLRLDSAHLLAYERNETATLVGSWSLQGPVTPVGTRVPLEGQNVLTRVFRTQRPARIDHYTDAGDLASGYARAMGVRGAVGAPILVDGRIWGAMIAASRRPEPLPAGTEPRVAAFAELAAMAIANSAARTEIERLAQAQAALRRVATLVAHGAQTGEVFAAVAHEVAEVMHLPIAAVLRYDEDEAMTVVAARSDRPHPFEPGTRHPFPPAGVAARVRQTGRPARSQDYENRRDAFGAQARQVGLRGLVAAPIIVNGAVWGLVVIASTAGPVSDDAEDRLAEFTELLGAAVANTESRAELTASRARVVAAADETRRRLERDLHDGIQQRLVTLALKARTIETMAPPPADDIQCELSRLAEGLGTSLDELREISRGIHPAVLSEAGLGPALKALARRSAVPVQLHVELGRKIAEHLEVAAYYIASEALTNAAKHAQASVVDIRVDGLDETLSLSIRDDGIGGADSSHGSGIIGLKDRVDALGGVISVLSPPGCGTTLNVQLPASPHAAGG